MKYFYLKSFYYFLMYYKGFFCAFQSPHAKCENIVKDLRAGFEPLVTSPETPDAMSPGLMLFMGFNGLFENLAIGTNKLISALSTLQTPSAWKTVDQVREAKALSVSINEIYRYSQILHHILFSVI